MKLTIDGKEFPSVNVRDWTFREADAVKRLTGLRAGEILPEVLRGDAMASLSFAIVGFMREKPGETPDHLLDLASGIVELDFTDGEEAGDGGPPADAAPGRRGARSRRSS